MSGKGCWLCFVHGVAGLHDMIDKACRRESIDNVNARMISCRRYAPLLRYMTALPFSSPRGPSVGEEAVRILLWLQQVAVGCIWRRKL